MTIYMIKKDKHTTIRTTQLHEARKIAKQVLFYTLCKCRQQDKGNL